METSVVDMGGGVKVSYVNIWIINLKIADYMEYAGDLDLTARMEDLDTYSSISYDVPVDEQCLIGVQFGNEPYFEKPVNLTGDKVVFNFIVSEVGVFP